MNNPQRLHRARALYPRAVAVALALASWDGAAAATEAPAAAAPTAARVASKPSLARAPASPTAEPAAALVLAVSGEPRATAAGDAGTPVALAALDWLAADTRLVTGERGEVELVLSDGSRWHLPPRTEVVLGSGGLEVAAGQPRQLADVPPPPAIPPIGSEVRTTLTAVRIRAGGFTALYPGNGARALADAAELRFAAGVAAPAYVVEVEDEAGRTVLELETRESTVAIPPGVLAPGEAYVWRVRTRDPSGMLLWEEALFATLTATEAAERAAVRAAAESAADATAWLVLAGVDRALGLTREAVAALDRALALGGPAPGLRETRRRLAAELALEP